MRSTRSATCAPLTTYRAGFRDATSGSLSRLSPDRPATGTGNRESPARRGHRSKAAATLSIPLEETFPAAGILVFRGRCDLYLIYIFLYNWQLNGFETRRFYSGHQAPVRLARDAHPAQPQSAALVLADSSLRSSTTHPGCSAPTPTVHAPGAPVRTAALSDSDGLVWHPHCRSFALFSLGGAVA